MNGLQRLIVITAFLLTCISFAGACRAEGDVPTFVIHANRYKFDPSEISLVQGKKARLAFISDDVAHGIAVDALGISIVFSKTHPAILVVSPANVGTFEGRCSKYCGIGHNQMRLIIHVAARR